MPRLSTLRSIFNFSPFLGGGGAQGDPPQPPDPLFNEGSTKEPMSDGGKRNVNFVMTEEVLQCQDQAAWGLLQPKQTN